MAKLKIRFNYEGEDDYSGSISHLEFVVDNKNFSLIHSNESFFNGFDGKKYQELIWDGCQIRSSENEFVPVTDQDFLHKLLNKTSKLVAWFDDDVPYEVKDISNIIINDTIARYENVEAKIIN